MTRHYDFAIKMRSLACFVFLRHQVLELMFFPVEGMDSNEVGKTVQPFS
jgi:hypothetical protein